MDAVCQDSQNRSKLAKPIHFLVLKNLSFCRSKPQFFNQIIAGHFKQWNSLPFHSHHRPTIDPFKCSRSVPWASTPIFTPINIIVTIVKRLVCLLIFLCRFVTLSILTVCSLYVSSISVFYYLVCFDVFPSVLHMLSMSSACLRAKSMPLWERDYVLHKSHIIQLLLLFVLFLNIYLNLSVKDILCLVLFLYYITGSS